MVFTSEENNLHIYDPQLGRFLSPDPYVQAPDFTQNYNRYSYVLNNPLKYTDPTGYRYDSGQLRQEGADARYAPFPGQYNYPFGSYSGSYTGFGSTAGGTGSASSSYYYSWNTGTYYNSNHQPVEWGEVRDNYVTPNSSYSYDIWWQTVHIPAHPELGKYLKYFVKEKRINYYALGYNGGLLKNIGLNSTASDWGASNEIENASNHNSSEFTSWDALRFLWNAKIIGREIPDNISLDLTISGTFVAGASMTYSVNFLTRGAPGIYLTRTEQERVIAEVDYALNLNVFNYQGNPLNINDQRLPGAMESVSGGFGWGLNVYRGFDDSGDLLWIGAGTGIGLTGGLSYGWGNTKAGWW